MRGLSLVVASRGHSSSRCAGLSPSWPLLLRSTGSRRAGSVIVAHGPSCFAACGIFPDTLSYVKTAEDVQPVSPVLAGRFSTTVPPGKPMKSFFFLSLIFIYLFLFMAVLGFCFCARAFSSCGKWGPLFIAVRGPLIIAASLVAEHRLQTRRLSNCGSRA